MTLLEWSWVIFAVYVLFFVTTYYTTLSKPSMAIFAPMIVAWMVKNTALVWFAWSTQLWGFLGIAVLDIFAIILSGMGIKREAKNVGIKL